MSESKDNKFGQYVLIALAGFLVLYVLTFVILLLDDLYFHALGRLLPRDEAFLKVLRAIYWPLIKLCELLGIIPK